MSQAITTLKNEVLVKRFDDFAPVNMNYESEYAFAVQHLKANDYLMSLANKTPDSLLSAMTNVAAVGLSLNPASKEAYLVPRKGRICFDPSYTGLLKLATDSGSILWCQADIVYSNDSFTDNGAGEKPTHARDPFSKDRGEFVGAYCVAKTKEGDFLTTIMTSEEIDKIMLASESVKRHGIENPKAGPWHSHRDEMRKKTVVRRAWKMWPRSDQHINEQRLAKAIDLSNLNEGMELKTSSPDLGQYTDEAKNYFDQLIEKSDALEMYVLQRTTPQAEFNNLYHSFDKGTKGKYQKVIDTLTAEGREQFEQYIIEFQQGGDVESEVSPEAFKLIEAAA